MLMRMMPSFVSTIPCNPTLPFLLTWPVEPMGGFAGVPPKLPDSLWPLLPLSPPVLPGREPHGITSRCIGLCTTGELCALMLGLTARRLKLVGSKSSSRRRLLLIRRVISAALGNWPF